MPPRRAARAAAAKLRESPFDESTTVKEAFTSSPALSTPSPPPPPSSPPADGSEDVVAAYSSPPSPPPRRTRLTTFVLLATTSFVINSMTHYLTSLTHPDALASISRDLSSPQQIASLIAFRAFELLLLSPLAPLDASILAFLTHTPHLYLLHAFYLVPLSTVSLTALATTLGVYVPFALFNAGPAAPPKARARPLLDLQNFLTNSLLGAALYGLPLLVSYATTVLPVFLASRFDGLKTLEPAHDSSLFSAALLFTLPLGAAATKFLLSPAIEAGRLHAALVEVDELEFDAATATLSETIYYNVVFWKRYPPPARVLLQRVAALAGATLLFGGVQTFAEVEGVEFAGAMGWAGLWATSAVLLGGVYGWVGGLW